jgi:hypothetical protein
MGVVDLIIDGKRDGSDIRACRDAKPEEVRLCDLLESNPGGVVMIAPLDRTMPSAHTPIRFLAGDDHVCWSTQIGAAKAHNG